jgi:hypothetical protein
MGFVMDRLRAALVWSGSYATLSMFVITSADETPELDPNHVPAADLVRTYELEDEAGVLRGRSVYEYDLVWRKLPDDVTDIVEAWLTSALAHGVVMAWFGLEGSFDFGHLLSPDVASQVYAVADGEAVRIALDDEYRMSQDWARLLDELRGKLLR